MFGATKLAERVQLFRQLATLVHAGMSLGMALSTVEEQGGSVEQRQALRDAARSVSSGKRFSEAMQRHPKVFSELNVALIAAGEEGGHLDEMLTLSADYLERDLEFQQTLARETLYPKILLAAVLLIPLGARMVIAALTLSLAQALVIGIKYMALLGLVVGLPVVLLWLLYRRYYHGTAQGRRMIDAFKLRIPVLGAVSTKLSWAHLCRALSALYGAGVNIRSAVEIASNTAANRAIEEALERSIPALERGEKLSEAMAKTGQIPPLALSMLRTGEESGQIDSTMAKVADYFEAEAFTTVRKSMTMIVPIAVIFFGVVVLIMALQAYMGYATDLLKP
jgi:type IV pilus assembly protein PilC